MIGVGKPASIDLRSREKLDCFLPTPINLAEEDFLDYVSDLLLEPKDIEILKPEAFSWIQSSERFLCV